MKHRTLHLSLYLFLILVSTEACDSTQTYKPTEEEMQVFRAYASLALLHDSFPPSQAADSVAVYNQKADSVLTHFGFSREEFRMKFENIINSPERFQPVFQELSAEIRKNMSGR